MKFGYPTGYSRVPSYFGIKDWVVVSGDLLLVENAGTFTTALRLTSAPNPADCAATYSTTALVAPGMVPAIQLRTTGC